jgi:predicted Zn-dependent protease
MKHRLTSRLNDDIKSQQLLTDDITNILKDYKTQLSDCIVLIALTKQDLYGINTNFVFAEANISNKVGVFSNYHFNPDNYDSGIINSVDNYDPFKMLCHIAVHEIGGTWTLFLLCLYNERM